MFLLLILAPLALLFQATTLVELPISEAFATVGTMSAVVILVSEILEKIGWKLEGLVSNLRALGVGVVVGTVGAAFGWGMFADPAVLGDAGVLSKWYFGGPIVGLEAGLMGSLLFMLPAVKAVLELLKIRPKT